jgi:hypothetical protein
MRVLMPLGESDSHVQTFQLGTPKALPRDVTLAQLDELAAQIITDLKPAGIHLHQTPSVTATTGMTYIELVVQCRRTDIGTTRTIIEAIARTAVARRIQALCGTSVPA